MLSLLMKIADLRKIVRKIVRKFKIGDFLQRMEIDAMPRTEYAYSLYYAAMQAKMLGITRISAIEFGVAGGSGLLALEEYSIEIEKITGVEIDVFGFDTGSGMPEASDFRDLPYVWEKGFFKMEFDALKSKLKKAELLIGNVSKTVPEFCSNREIAPIGFISFDLDYYSSTVSAFKILDTDENNFLPRVYCFFDDCIGDDWELHSEFAGELLAIKEFNDANQTKKLGRIYGLSKKREMPAVWNDELFVLHVFNHKLYGKLCNPKKNWQLPVVK